MTNAFTHQCGLGHIPWDLPKFHSSSPGLDHHEINFEPLQNECKKATKSSTESSILRVTLKYNIDKLF